MNNYTLNEENKMLKSDNILLRQKIKEKNKYIQKLLRKLKRVESEITVPNVNFKQFSIYDYIEK